MKRTKQMVTFLVLSFYVKGDEKIKLFITFYIFYFDKNGHQKSLKEFTLRNRRL